MMTRTMGMMTRTVEEALNEWMRRYIEEPERFEVEWKTITEFVAEDLKGEEPSYGRECAEYLRQLMSGDV